MTSRTIGAFALLAISLSSACLAAETSSTPAAGATDANPRLWQPRTKSVAVFKNGVGFFLRQGKSDLRDGWAVAKEIPPAKFGTLAVFSTKKDELVDLVGSGPGEIVEFDGVDAPKDAEAKRARLQASLKLNLQLTYSYQEAQRTAAGKLVSIGPEFVVLDGGGNSFAVPLASIQKMQLLETPLRIHVAGEGDKAVEQTEIGMAYLREGIAWIPEYSLRILNEDTAELTLRGTLLNEAEDLIHCDVNFVVGVPHFVHDKYLAPIAVGQVIRTLGAAVAPPEVQNQIATRMAVSNTAVVSPFNTPSDLAQGVTERPAEGESKALSGALGNLPQLDGAGGADYTVYTKKDLTVRRGEKAIVTLFVKKIRYGHLYRWSPPELMQHLLVLKNDTDTAWTTGPALAVNNDQPLSEDLLKYTPRGGLCELPVTTTVNVAFEKTESETDRQLKAHEPSPDKFLDLVTLTGQLKLRNFEKREVDLIVTDKAPGKPISASDGGVLRADPTQLQLLNRAGTVRWQIKLKPDETKVLEYKYERYVPSS